MLHSTSLMVSNFHTFRLIIIYTLELIFINNKQDYINIPEFVLQIR